MRAELMTIVVSQVDICARPLNWSTCVSRLGAKRLEPHLLRRQRCSDAPGWLHLDYFRVATIRPEQLRENVRKPTELIYRP
jgi:hypothetical protein